MSERRLSVRFSATPPSFRYFFFLLFQRSRPAILGSSDVLIKIRETFSLFWLLLLSIVCVCVCVSPQLDIQGLEGFLLRKQWTQSSELLIRKWTNGPSRKEAGFSVQVHCWTVVHIHTTQEKGGVCVISQLLFRWNKLKEESLFFVWLFQNSKEILRSDVRKYLGISDQVD